MTGWQKQGEQKKIENGILIEDVECKSPSTVYWVVLGNANNSWIT